MRRKRMQRLPPALRLLKVLVIVVILGFALLPLYNTVIVSLTPYSNMLEPMLYPKYFHISNFTETFALLYRQLLNSFLYAIVTVVLDLIIAIPAAYVIARFRFRGRSLIMFSLLFTQMLAGIVLMPSVYTIYIKIHLINTVLGLLILFVSVNLALTIWLLTGFFSSVPVQVEEASIIDGAGRFQLLYLVAVPMVKPGIAVSAIFAFINTYNEFVIPLFLMGNAKWHTLTLTLNSIMSATTIEWHTLAAGALIGMIPPLIAFLFFQKDIIEGAAAGAVKG